MGALKCGGVIFDLDGTLLDTIDDLRDAMNTALGRLGHPPRSVAECKVFVGQGAEYFAKVALPEARVRPKAGPSSHVTLRGPAAEVKGAPRCNEPRAGDRA